MYSTVYHTKLLYTAACACSSSPLFFHLCVFGILFDAPSFIHKFYDMKGADLSTPEAQQTISAAPAQALDMQSKLAVWYEQELRPFA